MIIPKGPSNTFLYCVRRAARCRRSSCSLRSYRTIANSAAVLSVPTWTLAIASVTRWRLTVPPRRSTSISDPQWLQANRSMSLWTSSFPPQLGQFSMTNGLAAPDVAGAAVRAIPDNRWWHSAQTIFPVQTYGVSSLPMTRPQFSHFSIARFPECAEFTLPVAAGKARPAPRPAAGNSRPTCLSLAPPSAVAYFAYNPSPPRNGIASDVPGGRRWTRCNLFPNLPVLRGRVGVGGCPRRRIGWRERCGAAQEEPPPHSSP